MPKQNNLNWFIKGINNGFGSIEIRIIPFWAPHNLSSTKRKHSVNMNSEKI